MSLLARFPARPSFVNGTRLTDEAITATRRWFARNALACIAEYDGARLGKTPEEIASHRAWRLQSARGSIRGDGDGSLAFLQRAYAWQTGHCPPVLA